MFLRRTSCLVFFLLCVFSAPALAFELSSGPYRVEIDPTTLAIRLLAPFKADCSTGTGGSNLPDMQEVHTVSALEQKADTARWIWDGTACKLEAKLDGPDLRITIRSDAPRTIRFMRQIPLGDFLVPLAEGRFIAAHDVARHKMLAQDTYNTLADLSLPLLGQVFQEGGVHTLLLTPYNNTVQFFYNQAGMGVEVSHTFSPLDFKEPFEFLLHFADENPLAGAFRYKRYLQEIGQYATLQEKAAKVPDVEKMYGATHLYLWGNGLLAPKDVTNWLTFIRLLEGDSQLSVALRPYIPQYLLQKKIVPYAYEQREIINAVNNGLNMIARASWQVEEPQVNRLVAVYGEIRESVFLALGSALTSTPAEWGDGLSFVMLDALQKAGLKRLWIGLGEGWEGALWHPEALKAFIEAGYIVAPYDSYATALRPGDNPDWNTGHLGRRVYEQCTIEGANAELQAGFQRRGHYTDPLCVRPTMEKRVLSIQKATGFNAWFLDSWAAGLAFENYNKSATMNLAKSVDALNSNMAFPAEKLGLVMGSEDGTALFTRNLVYAHGMQTPVFGWGDTDMNHKDSLYYVGGWYPPHEPSLFFKPVPVKEQYRLLHFAPEGRIPLYQAIFHGSVITSHHWLWDSVKVTNVFKPNTLMQFLYNVPPLFHISGSAMDLLPLIARQDRVFRPIHSRLATESLVGFRYLTADRLVQETRFSDGTRIVANFSSESIHAKDGVYPLESLSLFIPGQTQRNIPMTEIFP